MYGTTLGGKLPVRVAGRRVCNCNLSVCNMQEPTHSVSAVCPTFRARNSRKTAAEYFLLVLRRPSSQNMHQLLFSVYNLPLASVQLEKKFIQSKTKMLPVFCLLLSLGSNFEGELCIFIESQDIALYESFFLTPYQSLP